MAVLRSGTTSYYQADALRTVTSLSNSGGALANTYTYDSYGKLTVSTGSLTNAFQYTGREFDSDTGLYFNRARYYDPVTGRWLSEDPIRFFGDKNFYRYSLDNPSTHSDPSGLQVPAPGLAPIPGAGPLIIIGIDAWLARHDWQEFQKLCAAYGWSWCAPTPPTQPEPSPDPSPNPSPSPSPNGKCDKSDDLCYQLYLSQTAECGERHTDDTGYEQCMEVAWLNYQRCKDKLPPVPLP